MLEKYFNEELLAEMMVKKQGFIKSYSINELSIYGKWLKYKKIKSVNSDKYSFDIPQEINDAIDKEIEAELIDFSTKHYSAFNYVINYHDIDVAMDNVKKYKLKLPLPLPITNNEYMTIANVDNDIYRRILFCMLVSAKYYIFYNTSLQNRKDYSSYTRFFVQISDTDIFKSMDIKFVNMDAKVKIWNRMKQDIPDLCGISNGKYNNRFISFVDVDEDNNANPNDYITDYGRLDLHYRKLFLGENYSPCKYCGKLFMQNKRGNALFCKEHRIYRKNEGIKICEKCGSVFYSVSNKKVICEKCRRHINYVNKRDMK